MSAKVFHIPFITTTPGLKLHSIVQRTPKPGNSVVEDHPNVKHFSSVDDLFADASIDAVVITTTPDSHFALTKDALEAGKHVLTEKPFVPTSAEAETLIAIAAKANRLICVYQNRRWDTDFLTVQHLISSEKLGRVVEVDTHFDRYRLAAPTNWKGELGVSQGGSALFDLGAHLIDQSYVLFGMPTMVHGRLVSQRKEEFDDDKPDAVSVQLTYPGGLLVHVRISALSAELDQPRFWVRGTSGSFRKWGLDGQEDQLKAGVKPTDAEFGKASEGETMKLTQVDEDGKIRAVEVSPVKPETYSTFYAGFAKALESGKEEDVPVKASEARDVLRIIEAVMQSAQTGRDGTFE